LAAGEPERDRKFISLTSRVSSDSGQFPDRGQSAATPVRQRHPDNFIRLQLMRDPPFPMR
jgi:hypothetical protein